MLAHLHGLKTRLPRTRRLHASHPLRRGLVFASVSPLTYGSTFLRTEVSARTGVFSGSGTKPLWTGAQRAVKIGGGAFAPASYVDFGTDPQAVNLVQGATGCTLWARVLPLSNASNAYKNIAERNDDNVTNAGWIFATHGLLVEGSSTNMRVNVADPTVGVWCNQCVVFSGDQTAVNQKIYRNGLLLAHTTDTDGSGTRGSDSANSLFVGRGSFSSGNFLQGNLDGYIEAFYLWNRKLSHTEILLLEADPYGFFRDTQSTPVIASAAGNSVGAFAGGSDFSAVGASVAAGAFAGSSTFSGVGAWLLSGVGAFAGSSAFPATSVTYAGSFAGDSSFVAVSQIISGAVGAFSGTALFDAVGRNVTIEWDKLWVTMDDVDQDVVSGTVQVQEAMNDTPSTAALQRILTVTPPAIGNEVLVRMGLHREYLFFGGFVTKVVATKVVGDPLVRWDATMDDFSWLMGQTTFTKKFAETTPSDALAYVVGLVPGITLGMISGPNDLIADISFVDDTPAAAATKICERSGKQWRVGYDRVFRAFVVDQSVRLETLDANHRTLGDIALTKTVQPHANRVRVSGVGTAVATYIRPVEMEESDPGFPDVEAGSVSVGVESIDGFSEGGGWAATDNGDFQYGIAVERVPGVGGVEFPDRDNVPGGSFPSRSYTIYTTLVTDKGETAVTGAASFSTNAGDKIIFSGGGDYSGAIPSGETLRYGAYVNTNVYLYDGVDNAIGMVGQLLPNGLSSFEVTDPKLNGQIPPEFSTNGILSNVKGVTYPLLDGCVGVPDLHSGDSVSVLAIANDSAAQSAFAALFSKPGHLASGIVTVALQDARLGLAEAGQRALAELQRRKMLIQRRLRWSSSDYETHPGRVVGLNRPEIGGASAGDFVVQRTVLTFEKQGPDPITHSPSMPPHVSVDEAVPIDEVANFTFESIIRHLLRPTSRAPVGQPFVRPVGHAAVPPAPIPPTVTTENLSTATGSGGTILHGTANPKGYAATVWFEYGTTTAYGTATEEQEIGAGVVEVPFEQEVAEFVDAAPHHFRAVVRNAVGTIYGADAIVSVKVRLESSNDKFLPTISAVHSGAAIPGVHTHQLAVAQHVSNDSGFADTAIVTRIDLTCSVQWNFRATFGNVGVFAAFSVFGSIFNFDGSVVTHGSISGSETPSEVVLVFPHLEASFYVPYPTPIHLSDVLDSSFGFFTEDGHTSGGLFEGDSSPTTISVDVYLLP